MSASRQPLLRRDEPIPDGHREVALAETERFVLSGLPEPPARVLEVGAGDGALAQRLIEQGWDVAPLDRSAEAAAAMRTRGLEPVEREFLDYQDGSFAAVLFTRSLHHLHPLAAALDHARRLLRRGGCVIAEELAFEEADAATVAWLAERELRCRAAGLLARQPILAGIQADPLARWTAHHREDHAVHTGRDLVAGIGLRFEIVRLERPPYLYRYLVSNLRPDADAARLAATALADERAAITSGSIRAVGLRVVARAREGRP
jgi:SAM-dependent methyltransferase